MNDLSAKIKQVIDDEPVALFMKGTPQMAMCGNSMRALRAQIGRFGRLLTDTGPDDVVRGLRCAPATATASIAGFHLFPFGGLRKVGNWLRTCDRDPLGPERAAMSSTVLQNP